MGRCRGGGQPGQAARWSQCAALMAISMCLCAQGQVGFEDLGGAAVADTPPAPPMRLSDVARQNTFEHHVASRAHHAAGPASAPAPAPMGMAVPVGAPGPGQLSVYDLLPPERAVEGVGMARAPAAFAPAPAPADGGFTSPLGGQADFYGMADVGQGDEGTAAAPTPAAPAQAPSLAAAGPAGGGGGLMQAVEVLNPPSPVAYVDPDGSIIYVGPPPVAHSSTSANTGFDQYFWPVVALLGLLGIAASVGWAFSKRRAARRYIDLKDTEMAMQQRDMRGPHSTA